MMKKAKPLCSYWCRLWLFAKGFARQETTKRTLKRHASHIQAHREIKRRRQNKLLCQRHVRYLSGVADYGERSSTSLQVLLPPVWHVPPATLLQSKLVQWLVSDALTPTGAPICTQGGSFKNKAVSTERLRAYFGNRKMCACVLVF